MKRIALVLATIVAVLLAGCPSPPLRNALNTLDLDKQLDELMHKPLSETVSRDLATLATRATTQGDAATEVPAAVSFYRIAATAAWRAGAPANTRLLPLSDKGGTACSKLTNGDASQPRDCAILRMAPTLAVLDEKYEGARKVSETQDPVAADKVPALVQSTVETYENLGVALDKRQAAGGLPESFDEFLKIRFNAYYCAAQGVRGRLVASGATPQQNELLKAARLRTEQNMTTSGVNVACSN